MTTITEYLAEQKRLAEAADEGPWFLHETVNANNYVTAGGGILIGTHVCGPTYEKANAAFIAAARSSVPRMIAALEAVVALNTGDNRRLYGNDFEAGMAKALYMVHGAIEAALGGETECGDYPAPCNHDPAHERKD